MTKITFPVLWRLDMRIKDEIKIVGFDYTSMMGREKLVLLLGSTGAGHGSLCTIPAFHKLRQKDCCKIQASLKNK